MLAGVAQYPISEIPLSTWETIVVGAGPAGGAAAALLAAQGVKVLLVDRASFPREKVCGDALVPEAMSALQEIGVMDAVRSQALTLPGYWMVSPNGKAAAFRRETTMVRRQTFDMVIAEGAVSKGAVFAQAQFHGAGVSPEGDIDCNLGARTCRCRILIMATGAELSPLRGLGVASPLRPEGIAVRRYYRSSRGPELPYFFLRKSLFPGYAWIFPMGQGYYNVGGGRFLSASSHPGTSLARAFQEFLHEDPMARELVSHSSETSPLRGAPLRCGLDAAETACRGRMLVVGEAIGTTIPGWGEGISNALKTGLLAAEVTVSALKDGDFTKLEGYPRKLARQIKPVVKMHGLLAMCLSGSRRANLLVGLAAKLRGGRLSAAVRCSLSSPGMGGS